jgi:excisionase family DNA binding protein
MKKPAQPAAEPARAAYRPAEAQKLLGIKASKFWKLVASGELRVSRLGTRCTLVPAEEIKRLVAGG